MDNERFMRMAMARAELGDAPFGAVIVQNGEVVATAFNSVRTDRDPSAHAELKAIRAAVLEVGELNLETCVLYTTVEPCPMCMACAMYAGIAKVVYGASVEDMKEFGPQIELSSRALASKGFRKVEVVGGILADLCLAPFRLKARGIKS